jgi:hypothetical protein
MGGAYTSQPCVCGHMQWERQRGRHMQWERRQCERRHGRRVHLAALSRSLQSGVHRGCVGFTLGGSQINSPGDAHGPVLRQACERWTLKLARALYSRPNFRGRVRGSRTCGMGPWVRCAAVGLAPHTHCERPQASMRQSCRHSAGAVGLAPHTHCERPRASMRQSCRHSAGALPVPVSDGYIATARTAAQLLTIYAAHQPTSNCDLLLMRSDE